MDYGNSEIEKLAEQYQGTVASIQDCLDEWSSYRQFLKDSCNRMKHTCCNTTTGAIFPNMSILGKICRVLPIHTADVERTFSQLKAIKTRTRN